jgi:phosphate transport system protein
MAKLHTDRDYESDLEMLRQRLLLMAGRVEEMIERSVQSLVERDTALAKETIEADHKVNRAEIEIDELCLLILVKRQPMASDLRFVTLALKMVTDLERIGDLAVNICERAMDLGPSQPLNAYEDVPRMAAVVQSMVKDAIDAFVARDSRKAEEVVGRDDEVDEHYHALFRKILSLMIDDPGLVQRGIHLQSVAKYLERMGDHATNLAEHVIFMIRAKDVRHAGKLDD